MDLTIINNQIEFAKNYHLYMDQIELPKEVKEEIYKQVELYNIGMITNNERYNQTLDTISNFMKSLTS